MMAAARIDQDPGFVHVPVMLPEVLAACRPLGRGTFVDATVGGGGHSKALSRCCRSSACSRSIAIRSRCGSDAGARAVRRARACDARVVRRDRSRARRAGRDAGRRPARRSRRELAAARRRRARHELPRARARSTCAWTRHAARPRSSSSSASTHDELADVIYELGDERALAPHRSLHQAGARRRPAERRRSICAAPSCARSARRASAASTRRRARSRRCASR